MLVKVRYLSFDSDLSTKSKIFHSYFNHNSLTPILLGIIFNDTPYDIILAWGVHITPNLCQNFENVLLNIFKVRRTHHFICMSSLTFDVMLKAISPGSHFLCLVVVYIFCIRISKKVPPWVPFLLILLANDIELDPGPLYAFN